MQHMLYIVNLFLIVCPYSFFTFISFRDLALADSEKKLKSVTNKLDSITSNFPSEKESLEKQLASVEENWRCKTH
jgi:hypothetical protein